MSVKAALIEQWSDRSFMHFIKYVEAFEWSLKEYTWKNKVIIYTFI